MKNKYSDIPIEHISCPYCGKKYGHHNTTVETKTEACSKCYKDLYTEKGEFVEANTFIQQCMDKL